MKYLKLFQTTLQYNNYAADEQNFILPNVSLCDDAPTIVYFNPLKLSINPIVLMADWTYGQTSSEPIVSGNLGNGEVTYYYKLQSENSWSTTKPSNAGSYNVRADIAETEDYQSGTCQSTFTITRANRTISFTSAPTEVNEGATITVLASPSVGSGDGTITFSSSNTSVARISNNVITGVSTGTVTITATISQGTNYNSASTSYTLTVENSSESSSHDFVEIGGVKWATMNIGANSITDTGLYFQWGDTQGYTAAQAGTDKSFEDSDYKYYDNGSYTKYNDTDELLTLQSSDDAVTAAWGGNWRMPTVSEWQALGEAVSSAWTTDYQGSGVSGLVCTDKTDSSKVLFFPAAGNGIYDKVLSVGEYGSYWASSLDVDYGEEGPNEMNFGNDYVHWTWSSQRSYGQSVRGILDE